MKPESEIALWRYGIIAPLLHSDPLGRPQAERLRSIADGTFLRPDKKPVRLSPETIRRWLYRYQGGGLRGLENETRKRAFSLSQELRDIIFRLRQDQPRWSLAFIFDHLVKLKLWNGHHPSRSALYRFCLAHGILRSKADPEVVYRPFEFSCFGQLWIADFMHGPRVFEGAKKRKTYLHAILDDATRYLVAGKFHIAENTEAMVVDIRDAIRRFGIPGAFYTDNGAAFKSRHLKTIAARLGFELPHSPPYRPQGRGKIERFFRTVRERFLVACDAKTLTDLNRLFDAWLVTYHQSRHDGIGESPLSRRNDLDNVCRVLPEVFDLDPLFHEDRYCLVSRNGTVRLKGQEFEVPGCLPGERVPVSFLPWDPGKVMFGLDQKLARPLDKNANAHRFEEVPFREVNP